VSAGVFGDGLAGLILHGSLVLGDYVPGGSDVDLLAVVEDQLAGAELAALVEAVSSEEAPGPVDLRLVTRRVAVAPSPLPRMEAYLRIESCVHVEGVGAPERDLVVELSVCRAHGRALAGPSPAELIGDVPDDWVVNVGRAQLADWQRLEYEPQYGDLMVFTACRVWRFAEERRHCSKSAAAEWVLARDPSLSVVEGALSRRRGDRTALDERAVRALLTRVLDFLT
jgi:hypothetical protein